MRKRLLSLVLSLIMVVNMTAVGLSAFAEEADETIISESLENEILIDGIINTVYLTSVGQYSALSSEEQAVLQEYYQLTDDQFTTCETLGYTILESVRIAKAAAAVDLSPEEYDRFVSVYGSENIANSELLRFHNTKHLYSPQEVQQILGAMLQGQAMQQAVLSIPPFEETTVEITPMRPTDEITSSNTGSTERTQPATIEREFINSPVQYYAKNNEQVNASTGTFSYRQNLFTFDGIGELDVSLDLVFTGNANTYYGKYIHTDGEPWWTDWYIKDLDGTIYQGYKVDAPLGIGWSFDLPAIIDGYEWGVPESRISPRLVWHYRMQNGGSYEICKDNEGDYYLEGYPKDDITVTGFSSGLHRFRIDYANGRYELFDFYGRIRVIGDRFQQNEIKFYYYIDLDKTGGFRSGDEYTTGSFFSGSLYQIVDTAGRTIELVYQQGQNVTYRPRDISIWLKEGSTEHQLAWLEATKQTPNGVHVLDYVELHDQDTISDEDNGSITVYFTYDSPQEVYCTDEPLGNKTLAAHHHYNQILNISTIEYQSGLTSHYLYEKTTVNNGQKGAKEIFRVASRYETFGEDTTQYARADFTYTNEYSGYSMRTRNDDTYADPNNLSENYQYSVRKTENQQTVTTTYNGNHLPICSVVTAVGQSTPLRTIETTYGSLELPIERKTTIGQSVSIEHFEYDSRGNIIKAWSPRADGSKAAEHLTESTYDSTYNLLTSRRYKRDATHEILEEYALSTDKKTVIEKTTNENGVSKTRSTYTYDTNGNLTGEQHHLSNTKSLQTTYDYTDRLSATRDSDWNFNGLFPNQITTVGGLDIDGNPIGDSVSICEYDMLGRVIREIDPLQNETRYEYDNQNRITKVIHPGSVAEQIDYLVSSTANITTHTSPANTGEDTGVVTEYYYDPAGNLTEVRDVETGAALHLYFYDENYRLIEERNEQTSSSGHVIQYEYDPLGRVTSKTTRSYSTGPILAKETWSYDDAASSPYFVTTHTVVGDQYAPSIVTKEYTNKYGDLEKIGYVTGENEYFTTYTYDYLGQKLTEKNAYADQKDLTLDYTAKWEYDHAGNVIREYDADGNYVSYQYDTAGRLIKTADRVANSQTTPYYTTYAYDGLGNVILETIPQTATQNKVTKRKYDKLGRVTEERILSDVVDGVEQYRTTTYTYDWRGNVLTSNQGGATASYTYDNRGQLTQSTTAGVVTNYTYDDFGNCLTVTSGGKTETYTYDLNSVNKSYTNRNGETTTYTLDGLGRITRADTTGGTRILGYTLAGQVRELFDGSQTIDRWFDDRGNLILDRETNAAFEIHYTYDVLGNRESMRLRNLMDGDDTYTYTYDNRGLMSAVFKVGDEEDGSLVGYSYDANGNLTFEGKRAVGSSFTYNRDGSVASQESVVTANPSGQTRSYTYYPDGNLKTETDPYNYTTTYTYDNKNQLVGEVSAYGKSTTYTYDSRGNRTQKSVTENGATSQTTYTYDSQNRLTQQNGTTLISYTYDDQGNLLTRSYDVFDPLPDTFTYDGFGQMTSSYVNGVTTTYAYRADGLRKSKTANGVITRHVWDGDQIVQDRTGWYTTTEYVRGIRLIDTFTYGDYARFTYIQNARGDVVGFVDGLTSIADTVDYDGFGAHEGYIPNHPLGYCGEYRDSETGFIYLRARYYDPSIGRFTSVDPARDGLNWYVYCNNNPVNFVDPTGNAAETILDAAGAVWSLVEFLAAPTPVNALFLIWDVASVVIPFVPGSYITKGGKYIVKAGTKADDVVDTLKGLNRAKRIETIKDGAVAMSYKQLKKVTKGTGLEAHHLIEKRFANRLGMDPNQILSVALDKDTHQKITNAFRQEIAYFFGKSGTVKNTRSASAQDIWNAIEKVYKEFDMTEYLDELYDSFLDAGHKVTRGG